jgi:glycosyltransferase involved in cell wall biosynthesis
VALVTGAGGSGLAQLCICDICGICGSPSSAPSIRAPAPISVIVATVAVVTSSPPFAEGGHLVMARELVRALRECGHAADLVVTPQNRFGRQASAYVAAWCTDVGRAYDGRRVDRAISLRYPAYAVRHESPVLWLNHRMREYYDLWEGFSAPLSWRARVKERARRALIHGADGYFLRRIPRRFAISATVQARLQRWGGISSEVLYPPPPRREYRCDGYGDYLFAVSRLTPLKRFDLLLRALALPAAAGIRCVIAGEGAEMAALVALRKELGLEDRVEVTGRLSDDEVLAHLARCRAVGFVPWNEDYGFVTVEAFSCAKPVITCTDSGGPAELVRDGVNGLVSEPAPQALAAALARIMMDRTAAIRMGEAGDALARRLTWPEVVRVLMT